MAAAMRQAAGERLLRAGHIARADRNGSSEADGGRIAVVDRASVGRRAACVTVADQPSVPPMMVELTPEELTWLNETTTLVYS